MRRSLVVAGALAVMLMGAVVPAQATTVTDAAMSSFDVENDSVLLIAQTDPSSGTENTADILDGTISEDSNQSEVDYRLAHVGIGGAVYEIESVSPDLIPSSSNHDEAPRPAGITAATPPPSMLLLVGTGLTGLAGMLRRRLARRHRIAW